MKKSNMRMGLRVLVLSVPLTGCGTLASNGIDYSSYTIPKISQPPPPPAAPAPACQMPVDGKAVSLAGCKTGDIVVLKGVNFEFDKSVLTVNAKALLDPIIAELKTRPDIKTEIGGHTDSMGSDEYNQKLSESRAVAVKAYLVAGGIDAAHLDAKGFGETMPVADNATDEGRELNRRVEMKVVEAAPVVMPAAAPTPVIDHNPVVILEPVPSFLQEPGAGIPTSIGVVTIVPKPIESGPANVTSQRALPENYKHYHPAMAGYPGSSFGDTTPPPPPPAMPAMPMDAAPAATPAPAAAATGGTAVTIANFVFTPETLTVPVGTTVTFTNQDTVAHVVKFSDKTSPTFGKGGTYSRSFDKPGEYAYQCGIHPSMAGKIIVQ